MSIDLRKRQDEFLEDIIEEPMFGLLAPI